MTLTTTSTVELRRRSIVLIPLAALLAVAIIASFALFTAGSVPDEDVARAAATSGQSPSPNPSDASEASAGPQDLSASVDVSGVALEGAYYGVNQRGRLVRIDLATGAVTVSAESARRTWTLEPLNSGVLAIGDSNKIYDATLAVITEIEGDYLAARPGEIWTQDGANGQMTALTRFNEAGDVELVVPVEFPTERFISAGYINGLLHVSVQGTTWSIDGRGVIGKVTALTPFRSVDGLSGLATRCKPNALECGLVSYRDGLEIRLPGDVKNARLVKLSPSGRYLLTDGPDGTNLFDLDNPASAPITMRSRDTWARGADLVVRTSQADLSIVDVTGAIIAAVQVPRDVAT